VLSVVVKKSFLTYFGISTPGGSEFVGTKTKSEKLSFLEADILKDQFFRSSLFKSLAAGIQISSKRQQQKISVQVIDKSMNFIIKLSVLFYNFTIIFPYYLLIA